MVVDGSRLRTRRLSSHAIHVSYRADSRAHARWTAAATFTVRYDVIRRLDAGEIQVPWPRFLFDLTTTARCKADGYCLVKMCFIRCWLLSALCSSNSTAAATYYFRLLFN